MCSFFSFGKFYFLLLVYDMVIIMVKHDHIKERFEKLQNKVVLYTP